MNWFGRQKRVAIYLRDGLACVWCGEAVEEAFGSGLTLDHLVPHSRCTDAARRDPCNLMTSCRRCNSSRGDRSVKAFARVVAAYLNHGADPAVIEAHVRACARRPLPTAEARAAMARRAAGR
jgi:hypothetical protein